MRRLVAALCGVLLLAGCSSHALPRATSAAAATPVTKLLVFVVENHSLAQMRDGMPATYAAAQRYGYADHFFALAHPSLPNYIAMVSGDMHGVVDDAPPATWRLHGTTIFGRALRAGRTAAAYADSMPGRCHTEDAGRYAVRHNPWTYFVDERDVCGTYDRPMNAFDADVAAGDLPDAGFVAPDMCHDAHNCPLAVADAWFEDQLNQIMDGPDWQSGHLAVVLTADEDDRRSGNNVLTVVLHPSQDHHVVTERLDHYALYGLYEDVLGLRHTEDRPSSPSMADAFGLPLR